MFRCLQRIDSTMEGVIPGVVIPAVVIPEKGLLGVLRGDSGAEDESRSSLLPLAGGELPDPRLRRISPGKRCAVVTCVSITILS